MTSKRSASGVPSHLKAAGRELWKRIMDEYHVDDSAGKALLQSAAEACDRIADARKAIDEHGVTVKDRFGELRPNPATSVEHQARGAMIRALSALRLMPEGGP